MERHAENTKKVLNYLVKHPLVEKVNHPSSKTRNSKIDKSFNDVYDCKGYDRVGTVKAIRMGDRNKEVVDLKLFTYQSWDDDWMSWMFGTYFDIATSSADLFNVKVVRVFNNK